MGTGVRGDGVRGDGERIDPVVGLGIVGIGFMGMIHYLAAQRTAGVKVVALCSRDEAKRSGDWRAIRGNFGPTNVTVDLTDVATYATVDELLADPAVDLVDLCLPTNLHVPVGKACLAAGKHVLVEKPIALSIAEANELLVYAATAQRRLYVGHVLPFLPEFAFALAAVQDQRYGQVLAVHLRRHISPPNWSDAIASVEQTGGPIIDLHIHDAHWIIAAFGLPQSVQAVGLTRSLQPGPTNAVQYVATQYHFGDQLIVTASSGAISQSSRPFTHGFEIYCESATLSFEAGSKLTVYSKDTIETPSLGSDDPIEGFASELAAVVADLQQPAPHHFLDGTMARDALALCLAEETAVRTGTRQSVAAFLQ